MNAFKYFPSYFILPVRSRFYLITLSSIKILLLIETLNVEPVLFCFCRKSQSVSLSQNNEGTPDSKHQKYSSYDSYTESSRYKNHDRRWKEGFVLMFVSLFEPDCQQLPGDKVSTHWDNVPKNGRLHHILYILKRVWYSKVWYVADSCFFFLLLDFISLNESFTFPM